MSGSMSAGLQNRAALQQRLLQQGLVTKGGYNPGYQLLRPEMQQRGKKNQIF